MFELRYCIAMLLVLGWGNPAAAETRQLTHTLNAQGNSSYEEFVQQAEQAARSLVQRSFAEDPTVTAVSVQVIGEHNGLAAPLLSVTASRLDWQNTADRAVQMQYFGRSSAVLLGFTPAQRTGVSAVIPPAFDQVAASLSDTEPNFYSQ